jgi:hypothetical protein
MSIVPITCVGGLLGTQLTPARRAMRARARSGTGLAEGTSSEHANGGSAYTRSRSAKRKHSLCRIASSAAERGAWVSTDGRCARRVHYHAREACIDSSPRVHALYTAFAKRLQDPPNPCIGAKLIRAPRLVREPRRPANTGENPKNAGPHGTVFARVRGCSLVWRPQTDRRGHEKGPQKDRSVPRVYARQSRYGRESRD